MKQFVPITDELLYGEAGLPAELVPYRCGLPCRHAAAEDAQPRGAFAAVGEPGLAALNDELSACRRA